MNSEAGFLVQARMGSSRYPGKVAEEFYGGVSILGIILDRLKKRFPSYPVILVTSEKRENDILEEIADMYKAETYRGSEEDVLSRFSEVVTNKKYSKVLRICADNPFIQMYRVEQMLNYDSDADYVGYRLFKDTPAIKTHLGFFPELISARAIKSIDERLQKSIYREHVTNFFYSNENESYSVEWIDVEYSFDRIKDVRLTVDTKEDFVIAKKIFEYFKNNHIAIEESEILNYLSKTPKILEEMENNIFKNEK